MNITQLLGSESTAYILGRWGIATGGAPLLVGEIGVVRINSELHAGEGAYIFLDDERNPGDVTWIQYEPGIQWVITRSFREFVELSRACRSIAFVSFDHDLADFSNGREYSGYDCAKWLVEHCEGHRMSLPRWVTHTQNPVGAENINTYLKNYHRFAALNNLNT